MKTESLLWLLIWATMAVVLLIGQYQQKLDRDLDRRHAEVLASELWPATVSTR